MTRGLGLVLAVALRLRHARATGDGIAPESSSGAHRRLDATVRFLGDSRQRRECHQQSGWELAHGSNSPVGATGVGQRESPDKPAVRRPLARPVADSVAVTHVSRPRLRGERFWRRRDGVAQRRSWFSVSDAYRRPIASSTRASTRIALETRT